MAGTFTDNAKYLSPEVPMSRYKALLEKVTKLEKEIEEKERSLEQLEGYVYYLSISRKRKCSSQTRKALLRKKTRAAKMVEGNKFFLDELTKELALLENYLTTAGRLLSI